MFYMVKFGLWWTSLSAAIINGSGFVAYVEFCIVLLSYIIFGAILLWNRLRICQFFSQIRVCMYLVPITISRQSLLHYKALTKILNQKQPFERFGTAIGTVSRFYYKIVIFSETFSGLLNKLVMFAKTTAQKLIKEKRP